MKLKEIVAVLQDLFDSNESQDPKRKAALEELMAKLKKKETKLRRKLNNADSAEDKAKYARKLKIVVAQQEKGKEALGAMTT